MKVRGRWICLYHQVLLRGYGKSRDEVTVLREEVATLKKARWRLSSRN